MKTSTLIFALAVPVALASPVQPRSVASPICNTKGTDILNIANLVPLSTASGISEQECTDKCLANTACNAISYGPLTILSKTNTCNLLKNPLSSLFIKSSLITMAYSDRSCLKASTPTAAPTTTTSTAAKVTIVPSVTIGLPLTTLLPTTTLINIPISTSISVTLPTSIPDTLCVASAVVNKLSTGICGAVTGGTAASPYMSNTANSVEDCAMDCAQNNCKSFGFFSGLCSLYDQSVSALNIVSDMGIAQFYDSSCYTATFCN